MVTIACFPGFAVGASIGTISQYGFCFLSIPKWQVLIFWLCPILILLALGVVDYISARATSIQSAMQISQIMRQIQINSNWAEKLRHQKLGLMQDLLTGKVPMNVEVPEKAHA